MTISFRWAEIEHLDAVCILEQAVLPTYPHPPAFFEECIAYRRVLLAMDGEVAVAYLLFQILWGNTMFLSLLRVKPSHQRAGVGKALVKHFESYLIAEKYTSYVTSSDTHNINTKKFFPDLGFEMIGELKMGHGGEMFYLKKLN